MPSSPSKKNFAIAQRVLIYRLGSLGDTVIALPALHLVAKAFPHAERRMLTNIPVNAKAPPVAAILENTDLVHGYFRYAVGTRSAADLARLWWTLVRWRPDVLVYLGSARGVDSARRDEAFFRLCGIRHRFGVPVTELMQQNRWDDATQSFEPEASRLARNLSDLGEMDLDLPSAWDLHLSSHEISRADEAIACLGDRPCLAVSVGTKVQSKDWGRENWRDLLRRLGGMYPDYGLVLAGAPEESESSEFAAQGWRASSGGPVVNLCGRLQPRESAAAFRRARLFIGHDSGPMHLAAAVQTPCVAIFAARNKPRVWFPYGDNHRVIFHKTSCWGCGLETCIVEKKRCLTSISVEEVVEQVRLALK
jgi:ADP-heptose:LPS heptosyltransferase